ncbi:unnamed protein product [Rhodiola kirilowii]
MDDENGLDLGLGLSCGDSSSKTAKTDAGLLIIPTDDGGKDNVVEGFKNFIQAANQKQDAGVDNQQDDIAKSQGRFFEKLSMGIKSHSTNDHGDEKLPYTNNKRKMFLDEMNDNKRHGPGVRLAGPHDKEKMSHISLTTDDGSSAENEDVAESEVECSTSVPISNHVTTCKTDVESEGTKILNPSSENEVMIGNMNCNTPLNAVRPVSIMKTPGYPPHGIMQMLPPANGERPATSPNSQMAFGYSPSQLPILTRDHTWGMVTRLQQPCPSNFGRVPDNTGTMSEIQTNEVRKRQVSGQVLPPGLSDATNESGLKLAREECRKVSGEAEASNRTTTNFKDKTVSAQPTVGGSYAGSAIKPGIAADIKFGGSGSCPNLPWVSTTGPGPNGRTISGVTYRFSLTKIKIVCACHGSHLTPEEFVRHASDEFANQNLSSCFGPFPNNNPAASAQS